MLSFCGIVVCNIIIMIGNKIWADITLRLRTEALVEGHRGQMIFSMFMLDRFELSSKPNIDS